MGLPDGQVRGVSKAVQAIIVDEDDQLIFSRALYTTAFGSADVVRCAQGPPGSGGLINDDGCTSFIQDAGLTWISGVSLYYPK